MFQLTFPYLISCTFLAPNNDALTPPRRRKSLEEILPHHPDALHQLILHADELHACHKDKDDHDDKEWKKKIFRAILSDVLNYHILPYEISSTKLGENSTGMYFRRRCINAPPTSHSLLHAQCKQILSPMMNHMIASTVASGLRRHSCHLYVTSFWHHRRSPSPHNS